MLHECYPRFIISTSELLSVAQYLVYELNRQNQHFWRITKLD